MASEYSDVSAVAEYFLLIVFSRLDAAYGARRVTGLICEFLEVLTELTPKICLGKSDFDKRHEKRRETR